MKVLVAGANGALGMPLTRLLLARGHQVLGLIRDPAGVPALRALGVEPIVEDALDREPPLRPSGMAMTNRLRTQGSDNLLAAADLMGARRMVTQSICLGYGFRDHGDRVITEDDPFGVPAGSLTDPSLVAIKLAEAKAFTMAEGIALRYGLFYGGDAP